MFCILFMGLYCIVLYCIVSYRIVSYRIVMYCIVSYCTLSRLCIVRVCFVGSFNCMLYLLFYDIIYIQLRSMLRSKGLFNCMF